MFLICMCPPLIYIAMDRIMHYVFSLRVFKQVEATHAPTFNNYFTHTRARTRIHSFFLTLTRG